MENINNIPKVKKASVTPASSNKLMQGMYKNSSYGVTDNGAKTFVRSGSLLLDFYAQAGAMRKSPEKALELFKGAFAENEQAAVRVLFYLRDVRGGQGERELFRNCIQWLGEAFPSAFSQIVDFIPEYGRWDDVLFNNPKCFEVIKEQLGDDVLTDTPSLLAKWLPTINASSATTRAKARIVCKAIGFSEVEYRKTIRTLRKKIKTVEEQMSAGKWDDINYSAVPSQAARIYKDAFLEHDHERYAKFIEKAVKGEVKINTSTLYPYQIYKDARWGTSQTTEALWKQLPDYTNGQNALVIADVSGSMSGDPISVSVSLALYFAERNKGPFKDHFLTFSANPVLQRIVGSTLAQKMESIERSSWDMNTDVEAAIRLILNTAIQNSVAPEEMPSTLYIISDMQFDECVSGQTVHDDLKMKYNAAGYKVPTVVFWNVNASGSNLPVQKDESGVSLVSGFSPVIFKLVVEGKTPEQVMFDTINSPRYERIVLK